MRCTMLSVTGKLATRLWSCATECARSVQDKCAASEVELIASTIAPTNDLESAIVTTLSANGGSYTAIVRGAGGTTGIAVVEVYAVN